MTEDEQLKIYARFQLYKFESLRKYGKNLTVLSQTIAGMMAMGATSAAITRYIAEYMQETGEQYSESLSEELVVAATLYAAIYGLSKVDFKLSNPVFGFSFAEQMRISRDKTTKYLQGVTREHFTKQATPTETSSRFKRIIKSTVTSSGLNSALGRLGDLIEQADVVIDRTVLGLTGWQSLAVMDSRTTPICAQLHSAFYPVAEYRRRSAIPNRPPRHPRCRTQLIRTYGDVVGFSLNDFLQRNTDFAKDFMGQKKYDLWVNSQLSINKFTDLADNRLFTNNELINKYNLK